MLAVAASPSALHRDHDRPSMFQSSAPPPVFGPLNPTNGSLNPLDDLLKHPLEFKQGCLTPTSGVLTAGIAEGKYKPINDGPLSEDESDELIVENPLAPAGPAKQAPSTEQLFSGSLDMGWHAQATSRHPGFNNAGNTCFLNSVLQCLLHTPPLLNILLEHKHIKTSFCMICLLRDLARASFSAKKRNTGMVLENLNKIAKGMRRGRQEDAHEFLRYSVDALQRSALAIHSASSSTHPNPSKIPPALAETSWVHAIFGGQLRSRISCQTCKYCSDKFDSLLDLSVDIDGHHSLNRALAHFVKPETLSGRDAYRCEKCKKPVTAEKSLTIHEAPVCLTIQLKRFTSTGKKINVIVSYPEVLDVRDYMSEGQTSKKYVLYGVINHFGVGPNSGHYTAHVRGADGRWAMMDDDKVDFGLAPPLNRKSAYVLFYIQTDKAHPAPASTNGDGVFGTGGVKRTRDDMESAAGKSNGTAQTQMRTRPWDPFPAPKKIRVEGLGVEQEGVAGPSRPALVGVASSSTGPLVGYGDEDEIEDAGEVVATKPVSSTVFGTSPSPSRSTVAASTTPGKSTPGAPFKPLSFTTSTLSSPSAIPTSSFYGVRAKKDKDKRGNANPWSGLSGAGNLHAKKDKQEQLAIKAQMGFTNFGQGRVKDRMKGKGT